MTPVTTSWHRSLQVVMALVACVLFARLAVRHVGESVFLSDQADQLQSFEQLLRFEPDGLWGPVFQQTDPPARMFGPLVGILAGVPVSLGLGIDSVHATTSLLLVAAAMAAFVALFRLDPRLAWCWLIAFLASFVVWWNVAINWSNAGLPSIGALTLGAVVACLRQPTLARFGLMILTAWLGLHLHLVSLPVWIPVAVAALVTGRTALRRPWPRRSVAGLAVAAALAFGPYLIAELRTGFFNTRAFFGHASDAPAQDRAIGRESLVQVLHIAADPSGYLDKLGITGWMAVALAAGVAVGALAVWSRSAWGPGRGDAANGRARIIVWLIVGSVLAVLGQAVFFVIVNRPLLGRHYTSVLAPFYVIPFAALVVWLLDRLPRRLEGIVAPALGAVCIAMLVWVAPGWADEYWERTDWTYRRIADAVTTLCGRGTARTIEGPGLATSAPHHDGVLRYLLTRGLSTCRYDAGADRLLVGGRDMEYPPVRVEPDGEYRLEGGLPPGIASYRRVP
jgi:hypothetical protein